MSKKTLAKQLSKSKYVVIVPAYNEQQYIRPVLSKILKFTPNIIVVDDGSSDKTYNRAQQLAQYSLRHQLNLGKGAAMKTGCEYAFNHLSADAVIFIDSDDQHDPKHLPDFIAALRQGNDLVFGVRQPPTNMPIVKLLANKLASFAVHILFGTRIPDIPCGYKALTKKAYQEVRWDATDYGVELEIAARTAKSKLPFATVAIDTIYHDYDRGMTILDAVSLTAKLIGWRLSL